MTRFRATQDTSGHDTINISMSTVASKLPLNVDTHSIATSVAISVRASVIHHIAEQATAPLATPDLAMLESQGDTHLYVSLCSYINNLPEALF